MFPPRLLSRVLRRPRHRVAWLEDRTHAHGRVVLVEQLQARRPKLALQLAEHLKEPLSISLAPKPQFVHDATVRLAVLVVAVVGGHVVGPLGV